MVVRMTLFMDEGLVLGVAKVRRNGIQLNGMAQGIR